jgi:eukaryotic-like serine/threonine-protein kinase
MTTVAAPVELIDHRYRLLAPLGAGGMGAVYRAYDRLTGQVVALKRVTIPGENLQFASRPTVNDTLDFRLSLAQEFKTLASLRHPHIISVLDYGFITSPENSEKQPYFTMDLLENAQTILRATRHQTIEKKIELLTQTLQALAYLHRRGIIHRDLKPDNVLVMNDTVKVLDFGLAIAHDQIDERIRRGSGQIAGTLAYLAPEVLQGYPVSQAADLYAVGVIAYELFSGRHPFVQKDITQLIFNIVSQSPNLELLGENVSIRQVVGRLLSKEPRERFSGDAYEVIHALSNAIDLRSTQESAAVRESFLQAAKFVGREKELATLEAALRDAIEGRGSGWLIAGESGVGKSRLLEELRARALVEDLLVLRGQGVSEGGGLSYQLWREPLRRLALSTELSDLEAGILKELVPDIADLIGRAVPDIPPIPGASGQQRLLLTIFDVIRRQKRPILLLLEDLQWTNESLEVLSGYLIESLSTMPLLVVATYRDDERADLPEKLPGMQVLHLRRFNEAAVAELSESMLGRAGIQPAVVDLLRRETEGNVFFLIEVVRALAEDAGSLNDVGTITLPQSVLAGGMMQIIQRRLERVPEQYHSMLRLAAVSGRMIDLKLLRHIMPDSSINDWLNACANAAVLTVENDTWMFTHDKLREAVLHNVELNERRRLHRQVAESLEALYPHVPSIANVLAYHWQIVEDIAKERHYRTLAGRQLINSAHYREAIESFERALYLLDKDDELERARLQCQIAEGLILLSQYDAASLLLEEALTTAKANSDPGLLAQVLHRQGDVADLLGDFQKAESYHRQCVELYRQMDDPELLADGLRSLGTSTYQQGKIEEALKYHEEGKAIYQALGNSLKVAQSENNIANAIGTQGDLASARKHLEASLAILRAHDDRKGIASCLNNLGVMAANQNDLEAAMRYYREGARLSREIGNRQSVVIGFYNLGEIAELMDDDTAAADYYRQGLREAVSLKSNSLLTAFMTGIARMHMRAGQKALAAEMFGLLLDHPSMINEVREQLKPTLDQLRTEMGEERYLLAMQQGSRLDLHSLVQRVLVTGH